MANINQISPDGGTTVYDIEDPTARSSVNSLSSTVGILSSKVSNLESVTLGLEDDIDHIEESLGTASTKNSTSVVTESTDLVESGAVFDAIQGQEQLIDDTVGFECRNLWDEVWEYGSINGADGTDISDNTYIRSKNYIPVDSENVYKVINGDRTGKVFCIYYDKNKTHVGTSAQAVDSNTDFSPNVNTAKYMRFTYFNSGNAYGHDVIFGHANLVTEYVPYHANVSEYISNSIGWDVGELLNITATSTTKNGVTFTVNDDGSVSTSGTSDAEWVDFILNPSKSLKAGTYKLSGCNGGSNTTYRLVVYTLPSITNAILYNGETTFTLDSDTTVVVQITVRYPNVNMDGKVFKPSITHVTVDEQKAGNSVIGPVENGTTASQAYAVGSHAIRNGAFITWKNAKAQGETINDASDYTSGDVADELAIKGYLGASDNLNSITTDGIYGFGANPTNAPNTSITHGMLIVKHSYSTILTQIIIHDTTGIFVRRYTNAWQPWIKYSAIKSDTFSGTTNASGNLSITTDLTRVVLGIELDNDQTALKYKTSNYIGIHIMNASTLEAYASQSVSGTYYYI